MFTEYFFIILGFVLLICGAHLLVQGATEIAKKFGISEIIIGLTIVAVGTSLPELVITLASIVNRNTDLIVGNAIGSNLANLLLIIGSISILKPIKFEESTRKVTIPLLLAINIFIILSILGLLSDQQFTIQKVHGVILLGIAIMYFLIPIIKREKEKNKKNENATNTIKSIIYMIVGGIFLKYGGDFVVNSAMDIAQRLNMSESVIGLTIVAVGTTLPELITAVVAILNGNDDIAEGNVIGSCIVNFCLIIGLSATLTDLPISSSHMENILLLFFSTVLIWLYSIFNKQNKLNRYNGIVFLIIYIIYVISLFI